MDPVQFRVAIPAADPPDNITHDFSDCAGDPRHVPCCGHSDIMTDNLIRYRQEWFSSGAGARRDILAGIVVALALIPEAGRA